MFSPSSADNGNTTTVLSLQRLLANYDPLELPVANSSQRVSLNMSMGLKGFVELDMKKQTLVSFGWVTVTWYDQFLRWDLEQYPVHAIYPKADMVWRPDLVILNTVSKLDQFETMKMKVIVEHTGKVMWFPGGLFQTFCSIDILRYPLDTQTCSVEVSSWIYPGNAMNVALMNPSFTSARIIENHPEWKLVRTSALMLSKYDTWVVSFSFTLKRRVMFYILNMIFPIFLLSLLSCLVFLLPADSGEKMTVSVTIFLSFAVLLSLINNSLPTNSDSVCLFSVYIAVQMFISVSIVIAAFIVFMNRGDEESDFVPKISNDVRSDSRANIALEMAPSSPASVSKRTIWKNFFLYKSESSMSSTSQLGTKSADADNGTENQDNENSGNAKYQNDNLSVRQVWLELIRFHDLSPHQRRRLSRQLDCVCMKLSLIVNCLTCLVFSLLWIFM
ncbi:hypothetical protein ACOMHN_027149 [Nucella lapillus]